MNDCNFDTTIKTQIIHLDFGSVEVGNTIVRTIKVINESDVKQSYDVQRDPTTSPLEYVFNLKEYFWTLSPGCEYACDISYRPLATLCKNIDYFTITDDDENYCYKIVVEGFSIGPGVTFSKSRLIFHSLKENDKVEKRIKIKNKSKVAAIFQFDFDEKQCPFKLSPMNGSIQPSCFIYVNISFVPFAPGIHVYYLPCLILNQSPIIMELYGYFGSVYSNESEFCKEISTRPLPKLEGYEGYMDDVSSIRKENAPLISLSTNYIDFGQASIGSENLIRRIPQTVCFHNHSSSNVLVIWEKGASDVFKINPHDAQVGSKKSCIFEIRFDPPEEKCLYSCEILLRAFRKLKEVSSFCQEIPIQSSIPLITSLRMIGHSFPVGSKGWISHYQVPQNIIMPACIPAIPVFTTFLIRKLESQQSLMFRFVSPEVSNFTVKPMLGIIYKDYQIVTVEMFPEAEREHLYFERWSIQFNDCQKTETYIDFRGYAEYPNLSFETENRIHFDPIFPGCSQSRKVLVRNITRHCIKYSFPHAPQGIKIHCDNNIIHPNEIISHEWFFCPMNFGNYNFSVDCKLVALNIENEVKADPPSRTIEIAVSAIGEKGTLVAIPNELNFEELAFRKSKSLSFYLFNFSRVDIHFKMFSKHRNWPLGCLERDVKISPQIGTILPHQNEKIDVTITPQEAGFYEFSIQYFARLGSDQESIILKDEPKEVCRVNCMSVYPTLTVKDLLYVGTGPGVSKVSLWKLMNINKLNKILQDLQHNSNPTLKMGFPVFTVHEEPLRVELLLMNPMMVPVFWSLKRVKLCSCEKKYKTKSFSFQSPTYDCIHREICKFFPKSGTIKPREEARLSIEIKYHLLGTTKLEWELEFGQDRRVTLKAKVKCISEETEELELFFQTPPLKFDKVYIGDLNPIHQMCWVYNPTGREISYSLDTETLNKINEKFGGEIFSCINPSGSLKGLSHQPIIFKYHPRQFQEFNIRIPIKLGKRETELILEGSSSQNPITKVVERISPYRDKFLIPEVPVYFNTDSLTISPIPTNSTVTRMIMIHNRHPQDVLGYSWERYEVPEIIKAKVQPSEGRIQPLKMQTFLLTVYAGARPSKITICVTCKFINVSERRVYEKEVLTLFHKSKELENEFVITEKGIHYPKDKLPNPQTLKPPVPFYKGLTIRAYVYSSEDCDLKASLKEQLKIMPPAEIKLHTPKRKTFVSEKSRNISTFILECMIWDILNSKIFQNVMKEITLHPPDIKYSQIVMDPLKRKQLIKESYVRPPKRMIEMLLRRMVFIIVHEEYMLDTNHLLKPSDIRQLTYKKVSTGIQMDHIKRSSNMSH